MHVIDYENKAKTAERAYFIFLARQQNGLPGSEHEDWKRAEAETTPDLSYSDSPSVSIIKGIGPKVADELNTQGVMTVADLAKWTLADFGERLPRLTTRARSGQWLEQAARLSS
tara:strand:- start:1321 stop:1662 length:342 start_codon:yes stop_codon:yes gene_type:complete